ncbi:MAG: hypothetical protein KatS3mg115_1118 [Candidatus Poribacteria bacterium]|nr:MAG: hypothetical protein KatS3mg115_1118 [Candidatus Poribacteria bacterium]
MWQDVAALGTVGLTAGWFLYRFVRRRRSGRPATLCDGCSAASSRVPKSAPTYLIPTETLELFGKQQEASGTPPRSGAAPMLSPSDPPARREASPKGG